MFRFETLLIIATVTLSVTAGAAGATQVEVPGITGGWAGHIDLPTGALPISISFARGGDGAWAGTIDIPAQGAKGVTLSGITVDGAAVTFSIVNVPGNPTFKGTLSADRGSVAGTFSQNGGTFPFELTRAAAMEAAKPRVPRPQEPTRPLPYAEEEVSYRSDGANIRLAGTFTRPSAGGPFPAVLLITGSGAEDRDETIFDHKPFLVLSDYLTRRGIAVLRVDDRGVGGSDAGSASATTEDFAGDVRSGVAYLKSRSDVDARHIGLIGHSEGGEIAPMVAASSPDVAFIVMLSGPGLPGDEILYLQVAALAKASGVTDAMIGWDRSIRQGVYEELKSERDGAPDTARREALLGSLPPLPGSTDTTTSRTMATTLFSVGSSPWFRFFLAYDPRPALARVHCPVLAIAGENDLQVPYRENVPAIRAALEAGGNHDVTIVTLPKLNHLLQTSVSGLPGEYGTIAETIAPIALQQIGDWIGQHVRQ